MSTKTETLLKSEPIPSLLWKMGVPSVLSLLLYGSYNLLDTFLLSKQIGTFAIGALAIVFPFQMLLTALSYTLGTGGAVLVSQYLGNNQHEQASRTAANAFFSYWVISFAVIAAGIAFIDPLLRFLGATETLLPYAKEYLTVYLLGAPVATGFTNIIRAEGHAKVSMALTMTAVFANLTFAVLFIFVFGWGLWGAALAVVFSNCISFLIFVYHYFFSKKSSLIMKIKYFMPDLKRTGRIIVLGIPSLVQNSSSGLTAVILNNLLATSGGDLAISAFGLANRIITFFYLPLYGLAQALQPIVGYNAAADQNDRVVKTVKLSERMSLFYGIVILIFTFIFTKPIIGIFTSDADLMDASVFVIRIMSIALPVMGVQFLGQVYFQSKGRVGQAAFLSIIKDVIWVPSLLILTQIFSLTGAWISFPISAVIAATIIEWILLKEKKTYL